MKPSIFLFAILLSSPLLLAQAPTVNAAPNTLFTGADGKFEAAPDTALVQFNISAQADNAKAAYDQASKQSEQVRQIMRDNGIDPKTAQIGSYSIEPVYDWKTAKRKLIGYRVGTSVTLKLKDFTKIGPLTQQLADSAVSESQSISYTLDNMDEAKNKAVEDAYHRARAAAELGDAADLEVDLGVDAAEQRGERVLQRVGEHERPGDERDAEHDRQCGQR